MSKTITVTERSYCSYCGEWQDAGDEHDLSAHPATIHGDIERARERRYGDD